MKKRVYAKPVLESETFVPQNYIAACGDTNYEYIFHCNADGGFTGTVYYDDGDGQFDPSIPLIHQGDKLMGSGYHACNATHKTEDGDEFIRGWYITGKEAIEGGKLVQAVIIWRGVEGTNIHCTTVLDKSEWETAKS